MDQDGDQGPSNPGHGTRRALLVVLAEAPVAPEPSKGPFDDPAPFDELEPLGGRGFLAWLEPDLAGHVIAAADDLQRAACGLLHGKLTTARIAAIRPKMLEGLVSSVGALDHLQGPVPVLPVRRLDPDSQRKPGHVGDEVSLPPWGLFARIVAAEPPLSVVFTVWLSMIPALGLADRPSNCLHMANRAS